MMKVSSKYKIVAIGASAGGLDALTRLLTNLSKDFKLAILVVQHVGDYTKSYLVETLRRKLDREVIDPEDKTHIIPGAVYIAPPGFHMEINYKDEISLSFDPPINYSRPSIDVLFHSIADIYQEEVIGIILSGANSDGTEGIMRIHELGGMTIAQEPKSAGVDIMPKAAIVSGCVDFIISPEEIAQLLNNLNND
jgi:two-component system chemotaxis response regulator CheB